MVMEMGAFSISLAHTGRIPHREAARGNTPIPSKRLPSLISGMARGAVSIYGKHPFQCGRRNAQPPGNRNIIFYILVHSAAADNQGVGAPQHIPAHINPSLVFLGNAVIQKQRQIQERADRGNEIEEETILREQQKRCLAAAASYGWAVRREVFEPLQLSARGMDDRTGIQTILDDVCNRRFDLLMIASMDRLSYDKEEVKAFLAEMDLNGISIFNVGSNTVTLASGWDLMAFIRQMISPENGGDAQ